MAVWASRFHSSILVHPFRHSLYTAGIIVSTNTDENTNNGICSLREAITAANTDTSYNGCSSGSGSDTITFAGNYVITLLNSQLPLITTTIATIAITGNGVTNTIIQANPNPNTATYRILQINSTGNLKLKNLTIRNGQCNGYCSTYTGSGGGILNVAGVLTIINTTISSNAASTGSGGGIYNDGTLIITNSNFSDNSATSGAGIFNESDIFTITNSSFSSNLASFRGGGIFNHFGTLSMTNSTLSTNWASFDGGGVFNNFSTVTMINSTLSANSASTKGGGILNNEGTVNLINSTLATNYTLNNGGNIYQAGNNAQTVLYNTVLTNNFNDTNCIQIEGTINANSYNLDTDGSCDNATQKTVAEINLQPLANNGGNTHTHSLGISSVAIDAADHTVCSDSPVNNTSQNGVTRPQGPQCDIGAFEKVRPVTFLDVPGGAFAWAHIESIYAAGITGGCSTIPKNYCPNGTVTRAQMAVFLMKGINGSSYTPPTATGTVFNDVAINSFAAAFIEAFANEGITSGCGSGNYCPNGVVTRAQMAVFLLKAKYGSAYTPPTATLTRVGILNRPRLGNESTQWQLSLSNKSSDDNHDSAMKTR